MDATYHAAQDLFYDLHNPAPENPLLKLGNGHKEALNILEEIFGKTNPSAVPPKVPVRDVVQKKLQEVNREGTQMKSSPQSNPFTDAKHVTVPIVEAHPYEIQPVHKKTQ